jgi:hypothetical protein
MSVLAPDHEFNTKIQNAEEIIRPQFSHTIRAVHCLIKFSLHPFQLKRKELLFQRSASSAGSSPELAGASENRPAHTTSTPTGISCGHFSLLDWIPVLLLH